MADNPLYQAFPHGEFSKDTRAELKELLGDKLQLAMPGLRAGAGAYCGIKKRRLDVDRIRPELDTLIRVLDRIQTVSAK